MTRDELLTWLKLFVTDYPRFEAEWPDEVIQVNFDREPGYVYVEFVTDRKAERYVAEELRG